MPPLGSNSSDVNKALRFLRSLSLEKRIEAASRYYLEHGRETRLQRDMRISYVMTEVHKAARHAGSSPEGIEDLHRRLRRLNFQVRLPKHLGAAWEYASTDFCFLHLAPRGTLGQREIQGMIFPFFATTFVPEWVTDPSWCLLFEEMRKNLDAQTASTSVSELSK